MAARKPRRGDYLVAEENQPLLAIPVEENGREVTYYYLPRSVEAREW